MTDKDIGDLKIIRNVTDIIIKDLQGNYYDINMIYCKGNDEIIIEIKKPNEKYR